MKTVRWTRQWSPAVLALVLASHLSACGRGEVNPDTNYVKGTVSVSLTNDVTIDSHPLPAPMEGPQIKNLLRRYEGLRIGLEFQGDSSGSPTVVSPLDDKLHLFARQTGAPSDAGSAWTHYWKNSSGTGKAFQNQGVLRAAMDAATRVDSRYKAIGSVPDGHVDDEIHQLVRELKDFVNTTYAAASVASTPEQRDALIAAAAEGQSLFQPGGRLMSYEGGYRRPPRYYRSVGAEAGATVAILRSDAAIGSGFLVTPGWILTNRHVISGIPDYKDSVTIGFDYEEPDGGHTPRCGVTDLRMPANNSALDVAALNVKCPAGFPPTWQGRVLEFSTREAVIGDPVYVVGHPFGGYKQVADNAFVRFPSRFSGESHQGTRTTVVGTRALDWYDRFYQPCGPGMWCYFTPPDRWGAVGTTPNIPTLGFDSNTGPGSSGSPVLFVSDNKVAGLYFGGAGDYSSNGGWSFERHEGAIPSSAIVTWMKSQGILK